MGIKLGLGFSTTDRGRRSSATVTVEPQQAITAILMGQSEMEYLFNTGSFYTQITQPTPGDGNLTLITQGAVGAAPVQTLVNQANVDAGQVNPAMAALSAFLAHVRPSTNFVLGDGAVSGTSRIQLLSDDLIGTGQRNMSDFIAVRDMIEADHGSVGNLIECWYATDSVSIPNFRNAFWPYYFGQNGDGSTYTLGVDEIDAGGGTIVSLDYCFWDGDAPTDQRGRGVFTQAGTTWHVLTPMPFHSAPTGTEADDFSSYTTRMIEPAREALHDLEGEAAAQAVRLTVGPSAHISKFGPTDGSHPDVTDSDGQINLMWPVALALLRADGMAIGEPTITGIEGATDGTYADLVVDLPNGGTLTTLNILRSEASTATAPHRQPVMGVQIDRAGVLHPVYNTAETTYPADFRGTVTITDTGSGSPRKGRVRITPENPFDFGDSLSYLRGQATASTFLPRDFNLYDDMLIEHVPALFDASATYPFEGIAVRPYQAELVTPAAAPAFTARGATFDGTDFLYSGGLTVPGGSDGMFSFWFRNTNAVWATPQSYIYEIREGSVQRLRLHAFSTGFFNMVFQTTTGGQSFNIFSGDGSTPMVTDQWYHIMCEWVGGGNLRIYVNGSLDGTYAVGTPLWDGNNITQFALGTNLAGSAKWDGDMAHVWFDPTQRLDLSVAANREKFNIAGAPQNLGTDGSTPTGTAPAFYFDGDAPAWNNQGSGGALTVTGALTASGVPGY